ncbi:MAG: PRC-barrel domain-containing protein [Chitinispirillaceae bacterium]
MFQTAKRLSGMQLHARDGHIGKIDEFLFDDQNWAIRYLVADIGSWLLGRKVLLSPAALVQVEDHSIKVNYTKDQIRHSPDIDSAQPISRQMEQELHDYYSWPYYWVYPGHYNSLGGAIYPGLSYPSGFPQPLMEEPLTARAVEQERETEKRVRRSHLRSFKEVGGYAVQSTDEEVGHVEDFIVDDRKWVIRYLVANTKAVLPGKKVLLAPQWLLGIDWGETKVYADASGDLIRNGPEYRPGMEIDRDYENRLYDYYGRPKYWT